MNLKFAFHKSEKNWFMSSRIRRTRSSFPCTWPLKLVHSSQVQSTQPQKFLIRFAGDATSLLANPEHLLALADQVQERIIRNPRTGSLLIESTAISSLVQACTLLARQFSNLPLMKPSNSRQFRLSPWMNNKITFKPFQTACPTSPFPNSCTDIKTPSGETFHVEGFHLQGHW